MRWAWMTLGIALQIQTDGGLDRVDASNSSKRQDKGHGRLHTFTLKHLPRFNGTSDSDGHRIHTE